MAGLPGTDGGLVPGANGGSRKGLTGDPDGGAARFLVDKIAGHGADVGEEVCDVTGALVQAYGKVEGVWIGLPGEFFVEFADKGLAGYFAGFACAAKAGEGSGSSFGIDGADFKEERAIALQQDTGIFTGRHDCMLVAIGR